MVPNRCKLGIEISVNHPLLWPQISHMILVSGTSSGGCENLFTPNAKPKPLPQGVYMVDT